MGRIVTFYSYKGGVGRSMGLANIALLLAMRGLKVLAVDFDLEAPGLEKYFSYFKSENTGPGLLRMFVEARNGRSVDFSDFSSTIQTGTPHPIVLLASGREQDTNYSRELENFKWAEFFELHKGGEFVETLRDTWRSMFDVVLVDSRTGLSDTGGICTIQMPDIVVAMCTANSQSLYGVRDVLRLAQRARQKLAYDRMPLTVLPLPTRWGTQEFLETEVWVERVTQAIDEFTRDWLPRPLQPRDVVERLKVPQRDFFSFGEKLAVVEQGITDPSSMGFVYDRVAAFIASDCADIGALLGADAALAAQKALEISQPEAINAQTLDYEYDVFVSHQIAGSEWLLEFIETLKAELASLRGEPPRVFVDLSELTLAKHIDGAAAALQRSRVFVALMTPAYLSSYPSMWELLTFMKRSTADGQPLVVPVLIADADYPASIMALDSLVDLRDEGIRASTRTAPRRQKLRGLADCVDRFLEMAPAFDHPWALAEVQEVRSYRAEEFAKEVTGEPGLATQIEGEWTGEFDYEDRWRKTLFSLTARLAPAARSHEFDGMTTEKKGFGPATVSGTYDDRILKFTKTYSKKEQSPIEYIGGYRGNGVVSGKWFIGVESGPFTMSRRKKAPPRHAR